jgi:erythromycin esterase-like protein
MEEMPVPEAREGSIEALLHKRPGTDCYLLFREESKSMYLSPLGHRAIGVVYDPTHERRSNYVPSVLAKRYDALLFIDQTQALHPLHMRPHDEKIPETYPFGI